MSLGTVPFRMLVQKKSQTQSLEAEIVSHDLLRPAAVITLVKKHVDRLVDCIQSLGNIRSVGDLDESSGTPEQGPRSDESLFYEILADQECMGDFRNAETTKRLQNKRHLDHILRHVEAAHPEYPD